MARKQRIHYKGALYHVMARGNNGEYHLSKECEKIDYINVIRKYKERYGFKLYAYCIMDNHIHMLIEVDEMPLEKIMQGIQQVYTQRYNKINKRTGHIFQQRYKAIVCNKDGYLLHLIKYIHFNPVEAGITKTVDYNWSSHHEYLQNKNDLIETNFVLKMLSTNKMQAIKQYTEYMSEEMEDIEFSEYEITEAQTKTPLKEDKIIKLNELMNEILEQQGININELQKRTKLQKICDIRKAIVSLADVEITNKELSQRLYISESVISKIKAGQFKQTTYYHKIISEYRKA